MAEKLNLDALERDAQIGYAADNATTRTLIARIRELERAQHAGEAREPVAWHIGNADGSINKIGAVYIRRSLAEKHIASYAEGELDASIVPLYAAHQPEAVSEDARGRAEAVNAAERRTDH